MSEKQACHPEACAIQSCIMKNNYDESRCQKQIEALYRCCSNMYETAEREGKNPESDSCPLKSVVERRMKSFAK
ncbi:hypothetical protein L198_05452 [Cryptococcus wingfieldii CBS 7118]|uniref:Cx9C motif-containing protein 4, mitochondrial n=1 Tax=Cryptococcus wingfieldii CBS 7118 TaxID=1295528 RepID=A0A1E3IY78_9TREE|nr:hypothetical protein L198_05452 [Cryptococcus wingfieldii CBS 7118]ODN93583.1 hypothetical protein L198_05452 [Cryptococcus wingfieldii CBS 7118]